VVLESPVRERSVRVVGLVDAPLDSGGVLDLHARVRSSQDATPGNDVIDREHAALAEALQPHDDQLDLPAAVVRPGVDDPPDLLPEAVQDAVTEKASPRNA
jgi:hypothetical protein